MDRVPITREGIEKLKAELDHLQKVERPANIKAIEEARGHGDLSENAEYHAAKEKQGLIEAKMGDIKSKLSNVEIIETTEVDGRVVFGCIVVLEDLDTGEEVSYKLVGPYEADIDMGTISITAPIGKALIGREEGDQITVRAPKGDRNMEILEVKL